MECYSSWGHKRVRHDLASQQQQRRENKRRKGLEQFNADYNPVPQASAEDELPVFFKIF